MWYNDAYDRARRRVLIFREDCMMKSVLKKLTAVLFAAALSVPAAALESGVSAVADSGSLVLSLSPEDLRAAGFEAGDIVTVKIGERSERIPLCASPAEVLIGKPLLCESGGKLLLSCSYGHYAGERGLARWDGRAWQPVGGDLSSLRVTLSMAQKGGNLDTRERLKLRATNNRADYSSDAVFANFREVRGGRLGRSALYRSSIPSSSVRPRAPYADRLAREAGIKTVLNLANSPERLKKNMETPRCRSSYYRSLCDAGAVIARSLPAVPGNPKFRAGLAEELRFLAAHGGPYLVHCAEGKDRAGFVCFLLAALMGASPTELERDYGESFVNYYRLSRGEERYSVYVNDGLAYFYRTLGGRGDFAESKNLPDLARAYLKSIGLTAGEISAIEARLARDYL